MQGLSEVHCTVRKNQKKEFHGPCLKACKHYCLWALLPDRMHRTRRPSLYDAPWTEKLTCPNALLGRFVVHPDLLEPFIVFSPGSGMTDEQEVSVRKAFTEKRFLGVFWGRLFISPHRFFVVFLVFFIVYISLHITSYNSIVLFHFYAFIQMRVTKITISRSIK